MSKVTFLSVVSKDSISSGSQPGDCSFRSLDMDMRKSRLCGKIQYALWAFSFAQPHG